MKLKSSKGLEPLGHILSKWQNGDFKHRLFHIQFLHLPPPLEGLRLLLLGDKLVSALFLANSKLLFYGSTRVLDISIKTLGCSLF